ncbi:hypothetical protein Ocin01_06029 [Orchesella cincta]|uniref:MARVEL domain-containing protein n=1 Tax=Orchesella cincta TaxID=48709 RepID=A0A1D2N5V3_ORCCI|nr:hypothetical protein Ocin01_06029 [Orchesella cincta]
MSHTVTVTRTTTTSTTQAVLLNVGYLKTLPGVLKLIHVILGIVTVSLLGHYIAYHKNHYIYRTGANYIHVADHAIFIPELFFLLIATTCLITSTLLLVSCLISIATATIIPKTVLEIIYHIVAAVLLVISSIIYLVNIEQELKNQRVVQSSYSGRLAAAELTLFSPVTFMLLVGSLHYLRCVIEKNAFWGSEGGAPSELSFGPKIFTAVVGLVNSIFYGIAVFFAYRHYRSG